MTINLISINVNLSRGYSGSSSSHLLAIMTTSTTTSCQLDPDQCSTQMDPAPSVSDSDHFQTAEDQTFFTPPHHPNELSASPPNPGKPPRRKQLMKDLEWGVNPSFRTSRVVLH